MTYCLGMLLDAGLIMIADTRTNAGVDDISSYRKLHCLADAPDRCIYAASAGNLSTTQTVISLLREGVPRRRGRDADAHHRRADQHVPRRPAGRRGGAARQRDGRQGARLDQDQRRLLDPARRPDRRRAARALPDLLGRQFHRVQAGRALLPDRRDQIWPADPRSDDPPGDAAARGDEGRLPLLRRLDPLQPRGRPAARPDGDAGRARRARS